MFTFIQYSITPYLVVYVLLVCYTCHEPNKWYTSTIGVDVYGLDARLLENLIHFLMFSSGQEMRNG